MSPHSPTPPPSSPPGANRPPVPTSTTLFRILNPELFFKPNKYIMAAGVAILTVSFGYLYYQSYGEGARASAGYPRISEYIPEDESVQKASKSKWD